MKQPYQRTSKTSEISTVLSFRVTKEELGKVKALQNGLKELNVNSSMTETLRIILKNFSVEEWKQKTMKAFT